MIQKFTSPSQKSTLAKKIAFENIFLPEIKAYFKVIRTDFEVFYSSTGQAISMEEYRDITLALIKKQYNRVSKVFKYDLRKNEKKQDETQEQGEDRLISTAIIFFILTEAKKTTDFILQTNAKNITEAIGKARVVLFEKGIPETKQAIAKEASAILKDKFEGRTQTIAITETQLPAEASKQIEANVLAGEQALDDFQMEGLAVGGVIVIEKANKTWRARMNEVTRPWHARADGQTVRLNQPYIVDNEYLKFPRDASLGATAKNIANCYCDSKIEIIRNLLD